MILDNEGKFSVDQSLALATGAHYSDYIVDLGNAGNIGPGNDVEVLVQITSDFTSGGSATLQVELETASDSAFTTPTTLWDSGAITKTTLVKGYTFLIDDMPRTNDRYLRLKYTIGTAAGTGGTITAGFVADRQQNDFGG